MHRYARTLLYGILVFAVYTGISFILGRAGELVSSRQRRP